MKAQKYAHPRDLAPLYDEDFFAWTQQMADRLRGRQFDDLDIEHLAGEIEDMGKRDLKELNSRMQVLIMHLMKWRLQPDKQSSSWQSTIVAQRIEIEAVLDQSPSLRSRLKSGLEANYSRAVKRAVPETGLAKERFPDACPFRVEQILDEDFLPQ